jgi:hypothetical protein
VATVDESTAGTEEQQYPRSWLWDEDGDVCAGRFVRFDRGPTKGYGKKTIAVLEVTGEDRSVWLYQTALYGGFRDELVDRPVHELVPGERVVIQRGEMKETEDGSREYRDFTVLFPDRPQPSTEQLFPDLDSPRRVEGPEKTEGGESDGKDDDVPF